MLKLAGKTYPKAMALAAGYGCAAGGALGLGIWLCTNPDRNVTALIVCSVVTTIVCGWFSYHILGSNARAMDDAAERLLKAAHGDLRAPIAESVHRRFPDLAVAMESLLSQTRTNIENVQTLAMFDGITGLPNRTSFCRQVERMLADNRISGAAAMFFIDLDGFKGVNDTLGHAAGDTILTRVAGRLREVIAVQAQAGAIDAIVGRLAGDEFTMFFPVLPPQTSAMRIARSVQYALDEPFDIGGSQVEIGASIGVAYYPEHGETLSDLLRAADQAMYDAKSAGRRQVQLYTKDLENRLASRTQLERELRQALDRGEFLLEYQPQVDVRQGTIVGAEALVRWAHPSRNIMLPGDFVALAEETGLIVEIGDWVMNRVCQTAARWHAAGLHHRLSINISRRELLQPDFLDRLRAAIREHRTPPHMLELELSETLVMKLDPDMIDAIAKLRTTGVSIAIDDFGTGFSSLARLRDLPVDRIKIDRSLVRDIAISTEARTICSAVIGLVLGMGLSTVVEGVESEEQIELLHVMGCTVFQGFHLSRPMDEGRYVSHFGAGMSGQDDSARRSSSP